jgi:hypothetical protein
MKKNPFLLKRRSSQIRRGRKTPLKIKEMIEVKRRIDFDKIMERLYYNRVRNELRKKAQPDKPVIFDIRNDDRDVVKHRTLAFLQLQVNGIITIPEEDPYGIADWILPLGPRIEIIQN